MTEDGTPYLLVGAPWSDFYTHVGGAAYLVDPNSPGGSLEDAQVRVYGDSVLYLGGAVQDVGDLDGDGVHDLALGASGYGSDTVIREGGVFVFHGPLA